MTNIASKVISVFSYSFSLVYPIFSRQPEGNECNLTGECIWPYWGMNATLLVLSAMSLFPSGWKARAAEGTPILTSGVGQDFGLFCMDSDFEELDWDSPFLGCFWALVGAAGEPTVVSGPLCDSSSSSLPSLWTFFVLWWVSKAGAADSAIKPAVH